MHIPVLSLLATAAKAAWNKLRGRPTLQAAESAIAAGESQTINAPVAAGKSVVAADGSLVATDQATIFAGLSQGTTIIVQAGGIAVFVDGLPQAKDPALRAAFLEGQHLQDKGYEAQSAERHQEAIDRFTGALKLAANDSQRAALHNLRGNSYLAVSQYKDAEADYLETVNLADSISSTQDAAEARAFAFINLGTVYKNRGEFAKADEHYNKALEMARQNNNQLGEAAALDGIGLIYRRRGDPDKAEEKHLESAAIYRVLGERRGEAAALGNLGIVYAERGGPGDLDNAEESFQAALHIARELRNRLAEAAQLSNLAGICRARGELDDAEGYVKQSLDIWEESGNLLNQASGLCNLGILAAEHGNVDAAQERMHKALAVFDEIGAAAEAQKARWWLEHLEEIERQLREGGEEESHPEG
jgi:tetratricopeptide (TPR) repeat protein